MRMRMTSMRTSDSNDNNNNNDNNNDDNNEDAGQVCRTRTRDENDEGQG